MYIFKAVISKGMAKECHFLWCDCCNWIL